MNALLLEGIRAATRGEAAHGMFLKAITIFLKTIYALCVVKLIDNICSFQML
jgi:hypothetical protein